MQPAIHDVTDASALRSWFNPPLATSMSAELYKAQNVVRQFARVGALFPERSIPAAVLDGAAGFAVLSVVRVSRTGAGLTHTCCKRHPQGAALVMVILGAGRPMCCRDGQYAPLAIPVQIKA